MTGEHDKGRVESALRAVPGVSAARANHTEGRATVTADPSLATEALLTKAVRDAGYEPGEVLAVE